jgi:hypothetical protein
MAEMVLAHNRIPRPRAHLHAVHPPSEPSRPPACQTSGLRVPINPARVTLVLQISTSPFPPRVLVQPPPSPKPPPVFLSCSCACAARTPRSSMPSPACPLPSPYAPPPVPLLWPGALTCMRPFLVLHTTTRKCSTVRPCPSRVPAPPCVSVRTELCVEVEGSSSSRRTKGRRERSPKQEYLSCVGIRGG